MVATVVGGGGSEDEDGEGNFWWRRQPERRRRRSSAPITTRRHHYQQHLCGNRAAAGRGAFRQGAATTVATERPSSRGPLTFSTHHHANQVTTHTTHDAIIKIGGTAR
jgi:hypothetical protein